MTRNINDLTPENILFSVKESAEESRRIYGGCERGNLMGSISISANLSLTFLCTASGPKPIFETRFTLGRMVNALCIQHEKVHW